MKKILFLCIVLGLATTLESFNTATNFSVGELEKLCSYNRANFDTYVLNKGYSYWGAYSSETMQIYTCDMQTEDKIVRIPKGTSEANNQIAVNTTNKQYYTSLKATLSNLGYKVIKTEFKNGVPNYSYSNGKFTATASVYEQATGSTFNGVQAAGSVTTYSIGVYKN